LDSELLGHVKGAFSGAATSKKGFFEMADGGTLFLKNVQDIPLDKQALLLRFLQERTVVPIGSLQPRKVDARIIASATPGLDELVQSERFRPDLYYRLCVVPLHLPPLRERSEDILPLAHFFLAAEGPGTGALSTAGERTLLEYDWPGNVRELHNTIQRAAAVAGGEPIGPAELGLGTPRGRRKPDRRPAQLEQEIARLRSEIEARSQLTIAASPIWEGRSFSVDSRLCFVLMPFAEVDNVQSVYHDHLKKVVEGAGLRCERADDIHDTSGVMQSVWEGINRARVIIAEMTARNANVFYELGIAHTLGKPVIMITQSMDFVPFDLKHLRCILYDYRPGKIARFEEALRKTLERVLELRPGDL
jgi:sigma54-dependent transcription regulator